MNVQIPKRLKILSEEEFFNDEYQQNQAVNHQ